MLNIYIYILLQHLQLYQFYILNIKFLKPSENHMNFFEKHMNFFITCNNTSAFTSY